VVFSEKCPFYRANQAGQMACHLLSCYSFGQEDFGWAAGVADSLRIRSCAKLPSRTAARVGPTHRSAFGIRSGGIYLRARSEVTL